MKTPIMAAFAGNRFGKCLREGTLVRMADGSIKPIEQIRPGEYVVGVNLDGSTAPTRVTHVWDQGVKEIVRYRFSKRGSTATFDATLEHKMLARPEQGTYEKIEAGKLRSRWIAPRIPGFEAQTTGPDEEYATFLGLMLGDGHISSHTSTRPMQFTNVDPDILDLMRKAIEPFDNHLRGHESNPIQFQIARRGKTAGRNPLRQKAEEFGLNRYSYDKEIPEIVWSWSNDAVARVIAGMILTDGSVQECDGVWRVTFNSSSKTMIEGFKDLLETRFGVYGSGVHESVRPGRRPEYTIGFGNHAAIAQIHREIPLVGIKRQKLEAALETWPGKKSDGCELIFRGWEPLGRHQTWDITVDNETELFALANGLAVSNTSAGVIKNLIDALDEEDIPDHLRPYKKWEPPFYCWILGPTLQDSIESVILPEIKKWCPQHALAGGNWDKAYSVGRRTLTFRNGSQFKFFAYNQDHDQLTGAAVHRIHFDEPPPQKHRNEAMMRLATLDGDELFTLTPLHGVSWLEKLIWKQRHQDDITVVKGSGLDNPIMDSRSLKRIIEQYPEEERQARLHGDFVHFSGRIFKEFNDRDHVVDEIKPADLAGHEIVVGIDPGWDHGFAVSFVAFDVEGNCLVFDELLERGKTVTQVANRIRSTLASWSAAPEYFVIDSAGEQTSVITGYSVRSEFRRLGIPTRKAKNTAHSWQPSVDRIRAMLGHEVDGVDGERELRPRIKVARNCVNTIDSMVSYHYRDDADDLSKENRTPRPYKKDDDLVDALRYVVTSRTYQDPFFAPQEEEEEAPDLTKVAAMGFHLEQMRRQEEQELAMHGYY